MSLTDVSDLKPLLQPYGVRSTRVSPLAPGRFRVDTPTRRYEGRVVSETSAISRMSLADYAAYRQFRRTQRFLLTLYHDRFMPAGEGQVFYLTDAWVGPPLNVSFRDVMDGIGNLCHLHRAVEGYRASLPTDSFSSSERSDRWLDALQKGARWLGVERMLGRAKEDERLSEWLTKWEDLAQASVRHLSRAGYKEVARVWRARQEIAWNHYRLSNLIRLRNGRVATLQAADPVSDTRLYDLASFCQDICAQGHADGVIEAVEQYAKQMNISPEEKEIVYAFTAFPHQAFAVVRSFPSVGDSSPERWVGKAQQHYSAARALLKQLERRGRTT